MLNTYRRHDAVFIICQNNATRRIEIAAINDQAQKMTGYGTEEVVGRELQELVDDNLRELLDERVDFVNGQDDVADALMRVRQLSLKTKSGTMKEFRLRVVRSEVMDSNPTFT